MNVNQPGDAPVKEKRTKRRLKFAEDLEHHRLPKSYWDDADTVSKGKNMEYMCIFFLKKIL